MRLPMFLTLCLAVGSVGQASGAPVSSVSPEHARQWLCYTVPLPKQIEIRAETAVPRGRVALEITGGSDHPVYGQIRQEFEDVCGPEAGSSGDASFRVVFRVGGEDSEPLKKLANSGQAYSIASDDGKSLTVTSLDQRGAYYGWKVVAQLTRGRSTADTLKIPVLTVTDWPDMEKRGLWGTDNYNHLAWLGERRMNHMEQINARGVDENGNFYAHTREGNTLLDTDSEKYAIDYVPVILHLEQIWQQGTMGKFYPEMKARNATHGGTLCYAEPKTIQMISAWIYQLAQQAPTCEVDVWMTENLAGKTGCQCDQCGKVPYGVNEMRAIVKAWRMAETKLGRPITIYLLTSEATESSNPEMLAELPKEARVWYYHSLLTYNSVRQPMLRPYLGQFARDGGWLGVCPNLDAWTHNNVPCSSAAFIKYRMDEFVTKGLKGLLGYATPRVHFNKFNVEAAAEWTWNLRGRSTREFAYSYAVREGYRDPQLFADWSEALGPVEWDVYGSNWPAGQKRGHAVRVKEALKDGEMPELGFVLGGVWPTPWGNIKSERQLNADVAAAKKAIKLANRLGIPQYIYESLVVDGYIRTLKALYEMRKLAPRGIAFPLGNQYSASRQLREFLDAADQVVQNLPKWESCVTVRAERGSDFTSRPIAIMTEVAEGVKEVAVEMGARAR